MQMEPGELPFKRKLLPGQLLRDLSGPQRDIAVTLTELFRSYGLESLAPKIIEFIKQGFDGNTVAILLQDTSEYKERFKANETRRSKGLPVLSPAEYLSVEQSYRQIMSSAGLPVGFYDQPEDFQKWIADDVSPQEVKTRVDVAVGLVNNIDPSVRAYFQQWYSKGDMVAYALDRTRATAVLERQAAASVVGGVAAGQGIQIDRDLSEQIAQTGIDQSQARQGFGFVATERERAEMLSGFYAEEEGVDQDDLVREVFFNDAQAGQRRRRLASRERAAFSGRSGIGQSSLGRETTGGL